MPAAVQFFPATDPVGPASTTVSAEQSAVIRDVVAPDATAADRTGVRRDTIDALARVGLLGYALPPAEQREAAELIAGADASTWFCWVQHQTPLRTLTGQVAGLREAAPPALQEELEPGLGSGALLGAVAFAHVRRPGPANPVATRVEGGWRLDGTLDWVTSWDIADVVLVMAQGAAPHDDLLVCAYLPAGRGDSVAGMTPGPPLDLLAMSGTHTRPVRLDGVHVPDARVGALLDRSDWLAADAVRTADANPASFGVARGAIAELAVLAAARDDAALQELVAALTDECRHVRATAYSLADGDAPVADRLRVRARALDLTTRSATAVVAARAGAAMRSGESAERRVREAMFLMVQAQTASTRAASVGVLTEQSRAAVREG